MKSHYPKCHFTKQMRQSLVRGEGNAEMGAENSNFLATGEESGCFRRREKGKVDG